VVADPGLVLPVVGAGMVGAWSYVLWYRSIRTIGVARASALNISYAMWGALFAWGVYRTPMALLAIGGCVLVTAGAVATILSGGHEPAGDGPTAVGGTRPGSGVDGVVRV